MMRAKLLVALMGAACAGGGRHLPPAFKINCVLLMLMLITLHGAAEAVRDRKFYFLIYFCLPVVFFGHRFDRFWQVAPGGELRAVPLSQGLGVCFVPCCQLAVSCPVAPKETSVPQRCSTSSRPSLETKLPFGFPGNPLVCSQFSLAPSCAWPGERVVPRAEGLPGLPGYKLWPLALAG